MTPIELLERFRTDMGDTAEPYLWSDAEVLAFMKAAQTEFCRPNRAGGIRDAVSDAARIEVLEGEQFAPISSLVQKIQVARLESTGRQIQVFNHSDVFSSQGTIRGLELPFAPSTIDNAGPVRAILTNVAPRSVQIVHVPEADDAIKLIVERYPLNDITIDPEDEEARGDDPDALEVAPQHHETLLLWMRVLGYRKQDADTFDQGKADEYEARFTAAASAAAEEQRLREHKPRLIAYGGL